MKKIEIQVHKSGWLLLNTTAIPILLLYKKPTLPNSSLLPDLHVKHLQKREKKPERRKQERAVKKEESKRRKRKRARERNETQHKKSVRLLSKTKVVLSLLTLCSSMSKQINEAEMVGGTRLENWVFRLCPKTWLFVCCVMQVQPNEAGGGARLENWVFRLGSKT